MKNYLFLFSIIFLAISCQQKSKPDTTEVAIPTTNYQSLGDSLSKLAQTSLMSNVSAAIQKGGPAYAVDYCHENAELITGSLSQKTGAILQRISMLNRNPNNTAKDKQDSSVLNYYSAAKQNGSIISDTVLFYNDHVVYYKPITILMPTCLKCHGKVGKDIDDKTLALLNSRYPKDKAVNYEMSDLRGAWKITFAR